MRIYCMEMGDDINMLKYIPCFVIIGAISTWAYSSLVLLLAIKGYFGSWRGRCEVSGVVN